MSLSGKATKRKQSRVNSIMSIFLENPKNLAKPPICFPINREKQPNDFSINSQSAMFNLNESTRGKKLLGKQRRRSEINIAK